ncbi:tRNA (adenosine(37)-N6)-threonylcarbamoyltransferase complex transferase subunit TsaD [Candidatus Falkowbacteria bacterium]|nr:tRNA (adenosine(37)-N6)-threonylcarbamoyltransferase complex transferase subunit TsaD [Candidatus Falkowbacteria bacterium]
MLILGIETSCDDTTAAVVEARGGRFIIRSSVVLSQIKTHRQFGGIVPEVAARKHAENILPVIDTALRQAKVQLSEIDRIAVTRGHGLMTSLMVGVETAKTLSYLNTIPLVGCMHLEGHMLSAYFSTRGDRWFKFPALSLVASGGHTELIVMQGIGKYKKIGGRLDDAAGECFDKVAKILGLGYPGGPAVSARAKAGNPDKFSLPSPMLKRPGYDFSFSGLKTAVLYYVQKHGRPAGRALSDFCATAEKAITDVLVAKTIRAAAAYQVRSITLGGGVAANRRLRADLVSVAAEQLPAVDVRITRPEYCMDNAVMMALVGFYGQPVKDGWKRITADPNFEISN